MKTQIWAGGYFDDLPVRRAVSKMKKILWILAICYFIFIPGVCSGAETDIFLPAVNPDALIILDLSGSMGWSPAGQYLYSSTCPSTVTCPNGVPSYAGPYYATQQSGTSSCAQSIFNGGKFDKTTACTGPFYIPKSCVEDEKNHDPYSVTPPTTPSGYTV